MSAAAITFIAWLALSLGMSAAKDGKPKTGAYNFGHSLFRGAMLCALLYWGGFFARAAS